ncbi:MAG: Tfp pilus assembly protein FimT/FimU [Leptospirillia bacterium]
MKKHTDSYGFTLIELMVTLSVLAILAGIAIPSVLAWMPSMYLKDSARDIKTSLIRARAFAINQGVEHRVMFDLPNNLYQIDRGDLVSSSGSWSTVEGPHPLSNGIVFQAASSQMETEGGKPFLRFSPSGGVVTNVDALVVTLANKKSETYSASVSVVR